MRSNLIKITLIALVAAFSSNATEIFVADIIKNKTSLTNVKNITNREGYDNQPYFSIKRSGLYYTAMLKKGETTQSDTMFYDFKSKKTHNVTNTENVSEYSPTEIEGKNALSMIIVEPDGTQRLWSTELTNNNTLSKQTLINEKIKPVGYHAWGKKDDLILFVLGEPMTLQYVTSPNQPKADVIAKGIGRSLRYNAGKDLFTFTVGTTDNQQILRQFDANQTHKMLAVKSLTQLPKDSEYYTWLNAETLLSATGTEIQQWQYSSHITGKKNKRSWALFADVSDYCNTKATRLAVNDQGSKIAFVCDE